MPATARPLPPPLDLPALRGALADIHGIVEVRLVGDTVWAIVEEVDVDRDCRLAGTLAEVLPLEVEFRTSTRSTAHMVPDGVRVL